MIISELFDLQKYISSNVTVNTEIGDRDLGADEYPFLKIIPDLEFELNYWNTKLESIDFPVRLKIIVKKGDEIEALKITESLVQKINQYHDEKGHRLSVDGNVAEYVDDTKTYEITLVYILKLLIQDTGA